MSKHYFIGLPALKEAFPILIRTILLLADLSAVCCGYAVAYYVRFYYGPFVDAFPITKGIPPVFIYFQAAPIILFMWALAIYWNGAYKRVAMQAMDDAIRLFRASFLGMVLAMSAMFLYRDASYSRLVFSLGGLFSFIFVYVSRQTIKLGYLIWIRQNRMPHRVLILGTGYLSDALQRILKRQGDRAILKMPHRDLELVKKTIVRSRIKEVLKASPGMNHKEVNVLANFCEERNISFRILPDVLEMRMGEVLVDDSLGIPMIHIRPTSLHGTAFLAKRIIDVCIASSVLGFLFVPLLVIVSLIKFTSPGPIFYKHKRMGFKGREFDFMKFRTMVQNADDLLEELKAKNDRSSEAFKIKNDPRITKVGKFIRRFSIDEVPQLLNVLRGEMSVVGPRPQVLWEARQYDEWAKKRLNVLPGITGLWQVSGRAELTYQEMIDLDIYYIEHWSPGLDIKIIARTIPTVLLGHGAY